MASIQWDASLNTSKLESAFEKSNKKVAEWVEGIEKAGDKADKALDEVPKTVEEIGKALDKTAKATEKQVQVFKSLEEEMKHVFQEMMQAINNADNIKATELSKRLEELRAKKEALAQAGKKVTEQQAEETAQTERSEKSQKSIIASLVEWGSKLGIVAGVMTTLKAIINSSNELTDRFNFAVAGVKGSLQGMFQTIVQADFGHFIENMAKGARAAREMAEAIDNYERSMLALQVVQSQQETMFNELETIFRNGSKDAKERQKSLEEYMTKKKELLAEELRIEKERHDKLIETYSKRDELQSIPPSDFKMFAEIYYKNAKLIQDVEAFRNKKGLFMMSDTVFSDVNAKGWNLQTEAVKKYREELELRASKAGITMSDILKTMQMNSALGKEDVLALSESFIKLGKAQAAPSALEESFARLEGFIEKGSEKAFEGVEGSILRLRSELKKLNDEYESTGDPIKRNLLKPQIEAKQKELEALEIKAVEKKKEAKTLEEKIADLNKSLNEAISKNNQKEINDLSSKIAKLKEELSLRERIAEAAILVAQLGDVDKGRTKLTGTGYKPDSVLSDKLKEDYKLLWSINLKDIYAQTDDLYRDIGTLSIASFERIRQTLLSMLDLALKLGKVTADEYKDLVKEINDNVDNAYKGRGIETLFGSGKTGGAMNFLFGEGDMNKKISSFKDVFSKAAGSSQTIASNTGTASSNMSSAGNKAATTLAVIDAIVKGISQTLTAVADTLQSIAEYKDSIGDTSSASDLSSWANIIQSVNQPATSGWEKLKSGDIMGALSDTISMPFKLISAINKFHDSGVDKTIAFQAENVRKLKLAYDDLSKAIEKSLGDDLYINQKKALDNLQKQQIEFAKLAASERRKKKPDQGKINEYETGSKEALDQMAEIINNLREDILGSSIKEAANSLGDAFIDAFAKGEDAAVAWGNKVDEIVGGVIRKMLIQKLIEGPVGAILNKYMSKWVDDKGNFIGFDAVLKDTPDLAAKLKGLGPGLTAFFNALPDDIKQYLYGDITSAKGVTGIVRNMTEDTGSELTGIIRSQRDDIRQTRDYSKEGVSHLMNIEKNTFNTVARLDSAIIELQAINSNTKPAYTGTL